MQKQIRDQIVAVDKQMNMFDPDVAKPRKSIYEESTGLNDEGDEILRHTNPEDPFTNRARPLDYEQALARDLANDKDFTGKGALPENPNTISDIAIDAGGTPTAPVMTKAADKKLVKSIETSLNARTRRSPDEKINEILRHISDLEAKPVPKQARLAEADRVAKDKMLKYAYEAIESIQRNSYMGVDSLGTKLTRTPTGALDNIDVQTAETYKPKVDKPRFDNPQDYEFDEMLRSWDKEAQNIKTRDRYLPNGKRLDRSKLRDHEDPVKGALPDYGRGRIKKKDFFDELDTNILYHGGSKIDDVNLNKSNWDDTFYMSNNRDYAKSYGGNDSVLNKIKLKDKANLIDLRKPTTKQVDDIVKQIEIEKGKPQYKGYGKSFDFHPYTQSQVIDGIKQGKAHFIEHPKVKKILKDMGYDGMKSAESTMGDNIGVWNKKVLDVINNKELEPRTSYSIPVRYPENVDLNKALELNKDKAAIRQKTKDILGKSTVRLLRKEDFEMAGTADEYNEILKNIRYAKGEAAPFEYSNFSNAKFPENTDLIKSIEQSKKITEIQNKTVELTGIKKSRLKS